VPIALTTKVPSLRRFPKRSRTDSFVIGKLQSQVDTLVDWGRSGRIKIDRLWSELEGWTHERRCPFPHRRQAISGQFGVDASACKRVDQRRQAPFQKRWVHGRVVARRYVRHRSPLDDMDKKDIAVRILSLSAPNVYLWNGVDHMAAARHINDALAKLCRHYPDRLVDLASLPLKDIEASLDELDRCVNEFGMKGVTIGSNIDGLQLDDPRFEPIWAKINTLRLPVFASTQCSLATGQDLWDLNCHCGSDSFSTPPSQPRGSSTRVSLNDTRIFLTSWRIQVARC